jgi:hypothetical protein
VAGSRSRPLAKLGRPLALVTALLVLGPGAGPAAATSPEARTATEAPRLVATAGPDALRFPYFITVSPGGGPPGTVVEVTGRGFPPLTPVLLEWSAGVQYVQPRPIVTLDDGTFTAGQLVIPGDEIYGLRYLGAGVVVVGVAFQGGFRLLAQAPFVVVVRSARPPSDKIRSSIWGKNPVVFR